MKTVTMEELLTWAFVNELPKGGGVDGLDNANSAWRMLEASSWGKITSFAELGTLIDRSGGTNCFIEQGEPHEDAVTVGRAVAQLAACDIALAERWNPLADWPDDDATLSALAADAVARVRKRIEERTQARRGSEMVSLVVGTHTHQPTADHQILNGGTGYITDAGMCGDYDSSLGMDKEEPLNRFLSKVPKGRFEAATGPATLCGVAVEISDSSGLAERIAPFRRGPRLEENVPSFWS